MPRAPWIMTQTWHDLLFAHWRVDPAQLRAKVPSAFELDLFEDDAWIAVVPFAMTNVAPRGVPSVPWLSEFAEMNVRTYVRVGNRPGVYFFSLDAGSALAVRAARTLLNLPYYVASMSVVGSASRVSYHSVRRIGSSEKPAEFLGNYEPSGLPGLAAEGPLEYFLTERYCLYNLNRRGRPYRLDIHHPRWLLQPARAEIVQNTMVEAAGLSTPGEPPLLHFSKRQDMVAWAPDFLS